MTLLCLCVAFVAFKFGHKRTSRAKHGIVEVEFAVIMSFPAYILYKYVSKEQRLNEGSGETAECL